MNSYTIVKMLALCLGAVSVVTRTLPEQRSEIHARAAGGYGFSNNPTNQDSAGAMIDLSEFSAASGEHLDIWTPSLIFRFHPHHVNNHVALIPDVNDLKRRDGTGTAQNPGFWDFRDNGCEFFCSAPETPERNPDDCRELGELLTKRSVLFGVKPSTSHFPSQFRRIVIPVNAPFGF